MIDAATGSLFAASDLHVSYPRNSNVAERLRPETAYDGLIVAGDVGEIFADVEQTLAGLRDRFAAMIWVPGNHELWTLPNDPVRLRGVGTVRGAVAFLG